MGHVLRRFTVTNFGKSVARLLFGPMIAVLALSAATTSANAQTIVYTISGTGSGNLNSATFTDAAFSFSLTGNTSNITGNILDPLSSATATIAGLGTTSFLFDTRIGATTNGQVSFFSRSNSIGGDDLFDFSNSSPILNIGSAFSVTGTNIFALNQFQNVATSLGSLSFNQSSNVQFTSSLRQVPAVPEPATWAMMLMGFGAMGIALRRRKRIASVMQTA